VPGGNGQIVRISRDGQASWLKAGPGSMLPQIAAPPSSNTLRREIREII
jgi:hypothetical protein